MSLFPLSKARKILKQGCWWYRNKKSTLSTHDLHHFETLLSQLDQSILDKNVPQSTKLADKVQVFIKSHFKKTFFDHGKELVFALLFAFVVAFLIRQFWFELYEVPTGSMRPTIAELDRLFVSKTTFGFKIPFSQKHLFFNPDYLKRAGVLVFTSHDLDVHDGDTTYFYLFPGKKRFVKRNMGNPGDTLYFYGGRLYGFDKQGNPILNLSDESWLKKEKMQKVEQIPYISFEGKPRLSKPIGQGVYSESELQQMDIPVGRLKLIQEGRIQGDFFNGHTWVKDDANALKSPRSAPVSYSDLWGIGNYAMARLLTREQAVRFYGIQPEESSLFLELHHTPTLSHPAPEIKRGETGRYQPSLTAFTALIPIHTPQINKLREGLFTSRFFVNEGRAYRYNEDRKRPQRPEFDPLFPSVPNGLYEFQNGVAYKVLWGGFLKKLPSDHPLYDKSPEMLQKLFNLGIHFNTLFNPVAAQQAYVPQRFAYFRNGDLILMGVPVFEKNDPLLERFIRSEVEKQNQSTSTQPYIAFIDHGPPLLENGELNKEFIQAFGLKIPDNKFMALGDNYSNSADSRDFGLVPLRNLLGAPTFTFWPLNRIGPLQQTDYPWFKLPNILLAAVLAIVIVVIILVVRKRRSRPLFKKQP